MADTPEDRIIESVLDAVSEQRLPAGTKLGEQALGDLFQCNRANVRRALASLAAQHVVELLPNRGAFVATPSVKEARDVFQARRTIERTIARHLAGRASAEDIAYLRNNIAAEADARARSDKPQELRQSRQFHMHMARIGGNHVLERFLHELTLRSTLIIGLYGAGQSNCSEDEHTRIVDAVEAGDADVLVALIDEHLRHLEQGLDFDREPVAPLSLQDQLNPVRRSAAI